MLAYVLAAQDQRPGFLLTRVTLASEVERSKSRIRCKSYGFPMQVFGIRSSRWYSFEATVPSRCHFGLWIAFRGEWSGMCQGLERSLLMDHQQRYQDENQGWQEEVTRIWRAPEFPVKQLSATKEHSR